MPAISPEVTDKLRSELGTRKHIFPDKHTRDLNKSLEQSDRHMRHGAQVSNFSILLSDVLARASEDPSLVDQDRLPVMFKFLDDCLSSCLREFATCTWAAITSSLRRSLVLDNLYWFSQGSRERVEDLPLIGSDLFDNKFDEVMLKEAQRLKTDERIDLHRQAPGSSSSWSALTAGKESKSGQRSFRRPYSTNFRQPKATFNRVPTKPSFLGQSHPFYRSLYSPGRVCPFVPPISITSSSSLASSSGFHGKPGGHCAMVQDAYPIQSTFVKRHQSSCLFQGASQKHRGKPLLLTISVLGSFMCITQHTGPTALRPIRRTKHEAIMVKCLAQGHKCRCRESNPHSGFLTTPELEYGALDR